MVDVIEPAAEVYWDAVGEIIDSAGVREIRPAGPEEWEAVRRAAVVLAESGNLMMIPGRALDRGDWMSFSAAMRETALDAAAAAAARDPEATFLAGDALYYSCSDCHVRYAPGTLRPSAEDDPG
ncbi:MAG: hypothetical protein J4G03_00745 [Gemmatimonadetes bacterium]|nr:hypothetical protein [Gemmatimonadota bacterium]